MTNAEHQQLVEFLQGQFTRIDRRFDGIDGRLDRMDGRLDGIDGRLDGIDGRLNGIDGRLDGIDTRFGVVDTRFESIDRRFDRLETELREFRAEVLGHFDAIYRRLERLEQEYMAIIQGLRRIEAILGDEQARREILERSVAELKQQAAGLQARIEAIEARLRQ